MFEFIDMRAEVLIYIDIWICSVCVFLEFKKFLECRINERLLRVWQPLDPALYPCWENISLSLASGGINIKVRHSAGLFPRLHSMVRFPEFLNFPIRFMVGSIISWLRDGGRSPYQPSAGRVAGRPVLVLARHYHTAITNGSSEALVGQLLG